MSGHTSGPWHWDSDEIKGDPLGRVRYRVTTTGKTITQCYYSSSDSKAEYDARLIAAAPDLLEALNMVQKAAIDMYGEDFNLTIKQWSKFHAAIAKATGAAS